MTDQSALMRRSTISPVPDFQPDAEAQILSVAEVWLPPPPPSAYEIVEQAREVEVPGRHEASLCARLPGRERRARTR